MISITEADLEVILTLFEKIRRFSINDRVQANQRGAEEECEIG